MTKSYMAAAGMPLVSLFLVLAILAEIGGSLSVLLGLLTRWGAVVLIVFLFPAILIFHTNFGDHVQWIMFQKNVSMLGGLIMLAIAGPGDWSLDKRLLKL
jgi:putative oxidoreductase